MSVHALKKDFGRAWKEELMAMVKDYCDVEIDLNIAGLIFYCSIGECEECVVCKEMTDPSFSKFECKKDMDRNLIIGYLCNECEGNVRNDFRYSSEYPFSDDMD